MFTVAATFSDSMAPVPGNRERLRAERRHLITRQAARFVAEHVAVEFPERLRGNGLPVEIQAGDARKSFAQRVHRHIELDGHMEDGAHARAHHLAVVQVHAVGAAEAAEISEPRQRAQDGAEIAGILDLVKIDRALSLRAARLARAAAPPRQCPAANASR